MSSCQATYQSAYFTVKYTKISTYYTTIRYENHVLTVWIVLKIDFVKAQDVFANQTWHNFWVSFN